MPQVGGGGKNYTAGTGLVLSGTEFAIDTSVVPRLASANVWTTGTQEIQDAASAQLRLSHTGGSVYTDLQTDGDGDLVITTSGSYINLISSLGINGKPYSSSLRLRVNGHSVFDDAVYINTLKVGSWDGDAPGMYRAAFAVKALHVFGQSGDRIVAVVASENYNVDYNRSAEADPAFLVHSVATAADEWLKLQHNGTVGTLSTGKGDLALTPYSGAYVRFGTHSTLGAESLSGYVTIRDAGGTLRKLAVIS